MKTTHAWIGIALLAFCFSTYHLLTAEDPGKQVVKKIPPQRYETKVLKVFAAQDGEAIFRAYLVKWKDQEVIASDPLAKSNYKKGDSITILAMNHSFPRNQEMHRLLAFTVVPQMPIPLLK